MVPTIKQQELLERHIQLVLEYNQRLNLTRIDSVEEARVLHVEDSLAAVDIIDGLPQGMVVDMGSGAGFPGIPLAIVSERPVTLVESVAKKARSLESMISELWLPSVTVFQGRAEDLARESPASYQIATARALAPLPSLIELAAPLLAMEGFLVAYKAVDISEELEHAKALEKKLGMCLTESQSIVLSNGTARRLVVFQKHADAQVKLPRRPGAAQTHPYKA